jgi:hypothetical protein
MKPPQPRLRPEMTPSGTVILLHAFALTDGANVYAGLIQATDGNFYGTTFPAAPGAPPSSR